MQKIFGSLEINKLPLRQQQTTKNMVKDRKGKTIKVGNKVKWYDPDVSARDLSRIWEVWDVDDEMVCIADDYSEAEVLPSEVVVVS